MSSCSGRSQEHSRTSTSSCSCDASGTANARKDATRKPRISRWVIQELADICNDQVCTPELASLPHIPHSDLEFQRLLGEGGFSSVYEVKYHNTSLALKQIRRHKRGREEEDWVMAVFDLCNEATILGKVAPHENIVSIRGVCQASVSEAYKSHPDGWFFLEEKLQDTLADRLNEWRHELNHNTGRLSRLRNRRSLSSLMAPSKQERGIHQLLSMTKVYDRLQHIALGVANAMKHLHSEPFQIVLRDLKPHNIGFDSHGIVKLFDLGMARPIAETDTAEIGGTFRYLSPEAMLGRSISLQSDAYSFGVILYELATLGKPFDQYFLRGKFVRKEEYCNDVVMGGWRPDLSHVICRATARLISKCWDPSPRARPSFERIHDMLDHILSRRDGLGVIPPISLTAAESTTMMALSSPHPSMSSQNAASRTSRTSRCSSMAPVSQGENNPISAPPPTNHVTARGLFRGLKPLPNIGKRGCSDNTVTTSVSSSGNCLDAESD